MAVLSADLQAKLEAYLLGRLPNGEQTRIETLIFSDEEVLEAVRDAEDELIDRYVAGELGPADRAAFEQKFATSASRQERIAFARALPSALAPGAAPARRTAPAGGRLFLPAGAAAAAALALAVAWRSGRVPSDHTIVPPPTVSRPASSTATLAPPPTQRAASSDRLAGPKVATLDLPRVELRRSGGALPRLHLPEGTTDIRLQAEVETSAEGADYTAILRRVEGQVVWQGTARANAATSRLTVTVPARLVGPGDYVLRLAAPGTPPDDNAEYLFRISAQD